MLLSWVRGWQPRPSWGRIAVLAFAAGNALLYTRTVALAAVLMAPLLADALQAALPRRAARPRFEVRALLGGATVGLALAATTLPGTAATPWDAPVALSPILNRESPGVIFNYLAQGGWLYRDHPAWTPVFDTRWEVFGREAAQSYRDTLELAPGWQQRLDATGARLALLEVDSPLAAALRDHGWSVLGVDNGYTLLKRP